MDYASFYETVARPWRSMPQGPQLLALIDKLLVGVIAAAYGVTLIWLFATGNGHWLRFAIVPAFVLVLVTVVRKYVNAPRPYEAHDIKPLVKPSTKGCSMPSRHVASAAIIACALGSVSPAIGIVAGLAACMVAYARVAAGLHYPEDVVAGACIACVCGIFGFALL